MVPLEFGWLIRKQGMIRGIRPFAEIGDKAVLLRVEMDVMHQLYEITVRRDRDSAKAMFKQAAGTLIDLVDGLGVGVEPIVKGTAWYS